MNHDRPERGIFQYDELHGEHRNFTIIERDPPMFGPLSPTKVKFKRGLYRRKGKLLAIAALLPKGMTDDDIVLATGCAVETVRKLRHALETEAGKPFLCVCGKPVGHLIHCPVREKKTPGFYSLNPEKVRYIRSHYRYRTNGIDRLAQELGVSRETVYDALTGRYWKHIQNPGPIIDRAKDTKRRRLRGTVIRLLRAGRSARSISREIGMAKGEVLRIRRECGLPAFTNSAQPLRIAA